MSTKKSSPWEHFTVDQANYMVVVCNVWDKVVTRLSGSGQIVNFTIWYNPTNDHGKR